VAAARPPVRPQPEVAAGRPRPALAVRRRSASARGHPYNHQDKYYLKIIFKLILFNVLNKSTYFFDI